MSPSASIDHFELCEISLCQIALPAPLRQCLASTSACVTQTGPVRHGKHRPPWSCILCRGISTGLPEGLSPEMSMTRRRQTKQTGVLAYPHFLTRRVGKRPLRPLALKSDAMDGQSENWPETTLTTKGHRNEQSWWQKTWGRTPSWIGRKRG